jgi:hypothetical protein
MDMPSFKFGTVNSKLKSLATKSINATDGQAGLAWLYRGGKG